MTGTVLAQRIGGARPPFDGPGTLETASAKNAFLLNLFGFLGFEPPGFGPAPMTTEGLLGHLRRSLRRHKNEITEENIQRAHEALVFPHSRSIISACLFPGRKVMPNGVPAEYGGRNGRG